jgi:D-threo-aldose 1-dehydrogenase
VQAVGIGSKEWKIIRELYADVPFDWVMFANSYTLMTHPKEIRSFMKQLQLDGVGIINSALFHGGFLTGGDKFDYREVDQGTEAGRRLLSWRSGFNLTCAEYGVDPGDACIQFGLSHPAISAIALNTSKPEKMIRNAQIIHKEIPRTFWSALQDKGLIELE